MAACLCPNFLVISPPSLFSYGMVPIWGPEVESVAMLIPVYYGGLCDSMIFHQFSETQRFKPLATHYYTCWNIFHSTTCLHKKYWLHNHRHIKPYYHRKLPIPHYIYNGYPSFLLRQKPPIISYSNAKSFMAIYSKHVIVSDHDRLLQAFIFAKWLCNYTTTLVYSWLKREDLFWWTAAGKYGEN